jgi:hypothetical protein
LNGDRKAMTDDSSGKLLKQHTNETKGDLIVETERSDAADEVLDRFWHAVMTVSGTP